MSLIEFEQLPDESRVWIFGAAEPPEDGTAGRLRDRMRAFLEEWTAHRRELVAGFDWRYDRFLLVAVDDRRAGPSGCSIDALMHRLAGLEDELGVSLLDTSSVRYRDPDEPGRIRSVARPEFRRLAESGDVGPDTVVFDLTVDRVGDVRAGRWERPAGESWHASLIPDAARSAG